MMVILLVSGSIPAHAESAGMSMDEAVSRALDQHPGLSAMRREVQATRADRQQASYQPNPTLDVSAGLKDTDTDSGYEVGVGLAFPVERKGKREARIAVAQGDVQIAELALEQFKRDVERQVRTKGYEYLITAADAEVAREIAERSRAMIDLLKKRPAAGPVILLELRVIEGSLVEFQKAAREFTAQRDMARAELNLLLGLDADDPLVIREALEAPKMRFDSKQIEALLEKSPAFQIRLAQREKSIHEITAATLAAKPDYSVGPYLAREDAGDAETVLGAVISVPLTWRNRNEGAIAAARSRSERADEELKADMLTARGELARLLRRYELSMEQLDAIPSALVESQHEAADLADRQYRLGAISVQLFLDMQREFLTVQQLRHNALLEAWRSTTELQWLAGDNAEDSL